MIFDVFTRGREKIGEGGSEWRGRALVFMHLCTALGYKICIIMYQIQMYFDTSNHFLFNKYQTIATNEHDT